MAVSFDPVIVPVPGHGAVAVGDQLAEAKPCLDTLLKHYHGHFSIHQGNWCFALGTHRSGAGSEKDPSAAGRSLVALGELGVAWKTKRGRNKSPALNELPPPLVATLYHIHHLLYSIFFQ